MFPLPGAGGGGLKHWVGIVMRAERGDLNGFASAENMNYLKPPADDSGSPKQPADFLRFGVGCDVKIFGLVVEQQVAYAATYDIGAETGALQTIDDIRCNSGYGCW